MEVSRPWATKDVLGAQRFLQRMGRNVFGESTGEPRIGDGTPDEETLRALHGTTDGVHADYAAMRFNTAGAKLIELNNHVTKTYAGRPVPRSCSGHRAGLGRAGTAAGHRGRVRGPERGGCGRAGTVTGPSLRSLSCSSVREAVGQQGNQRVRVVCADACGNP